MELGQCAMEDSSNTWLLLCVNRKTKDLNTAGIEASGGKSLELVALGESRANQQSQSEQAHLLALPQLRLELGKQFRAKWASTKNKGPEIWI